jgi:N-acetylglutamate synthase-like GNAT family acetyltransferase
MSDVTLRTGLKPGDLGMIVHLHGALYAREYGLDTTFEPYVAEPLSAFVRAGADAGRIWVAERDGRMLGCVAIVRDPDASGQLRWFILVPEARRLGLGKRLLQSAIDYAHDDGLRSIYLWTFDALDAAIHLYRQHGFIETDRRVHEALWGRRICELRMDLALTDETKS